MSRSRRRRVAGARRSRRAAPRGDACPRPWLPAPSAPPPCRPGATSGMRSAAARNWCVQSTVEDRGADDQRIDDELALGIELCAGAQRLEPVDRVLPACVGVAHERQVERALDPSLGVVALTQRGLEGGDRLHPPELGLQQAELVADVRPLLAALRRLRQRPLQVAHRGSRRGAPQSLPAAATRIRTFSGSPSGDPLSRCAAISSTGAPRARSRAAAVAWPRRRSKPPSCSYTAERMSGWANDSQSPAARTWAATSPSAAAAAAPTGAPRPRRRPRAGRPSQTAPPRVPAPPHRRRRAGRARAQSARRTTGRSRRGRHGPAPRRASA